MKRQLLHGLLAVVLGLVVASCDQEDYRISLDRTVLQMEVNDTQMLTATVEPSTGESVTWVSSNPEVATVTAGAVVAVSDGRAEIRASVGDAVAVCVVYVTQPGGTYWGEYELVWEDNFDDAALDTTNWNIENGGGGWGNQEKQHYTGRAENLRVEDGCLVIEARREDYGSNEYTSARINTKGKQEFVYGKMEARICLPAGGGLWPAFWMLGNGSWTTCGEIDILEYVGNRPGTALHALHTRQRNGMTGGNWNYSYKYEGPGSLEGEFHVFGIEWLKDYQYGRDAIRFYVDDVVTATQYEQNEEFNFEQWPFSDEWDNPSERQFYFILNMAVGGTLGGSVNLDVFNNQVLMKVDWVRVYQKTMN